MFFYDWSGLHLLLRHKIEQGFKKSIETKSCTLCWVGLPVLVHFTMFSIFYFKLDIGDGASLELVDNFCYLSNVYIIMIIVNV